MRNEGSRFLADGGAATKGGCRMLAEDAEGGCSGAGKERIVIPCSLHPASFCWILPVRSPIPKIPTSPRRTFPYFSRSRRWPSLLGGNSMHRTIFVLALAALSCAGCRAIGPNGGG